ncbi:MAG: hypothetical protein N2440_01830 [Actinobacteria bacterium]|nr:hypothetical protein [Actinomycetota bacterium]
MRDDFEERIKQAESKFERVLSEKHPIRKKRRKKLMNSIDKESRNILEELNEKTKKLEDSMNRLLKELDSERNQS